MRKLIIAGLCVALLFIVVVVGFSGRDEDLGTVADSEEAIERVMPHVMASLCKNKVASYRVHYEEGKKPWTYRGVFLGTFDNAKQAVAAIKAENATTRKLGDASTSMSLVVQEASGNRTAMHVLSIKGEVRDAVQQPYEGLIDCNPALKAADTV